MGRSRLLYVAVWAAYGLAEAFAPGDWVSNYRRSPTILLMEVLRFPGLILLWYAVLAARIPHLRESVRAFYRRLLLHPGLLGAAAAVPAGALVWLIGRSPERAVGAVLADPLARSLVAAVGILLLVTAARERILIRLDAWILPETADQRLALADAAGALVQAGRITTVGETVTRTVRRGCSSPATLLVADDAETHAEGFSAPHLRIAPLPRQSAIVHLLETAGGPVRVDPTGRPSVFPLLPPDEAAWVTETGADVIVPVPGPGTEVLGVLVVGRRLDGRLVRAVDLPFLEALGAAAGLVLARLQLFDGPGAGSGDAPPAEECPVCRCLTAAGEAPGCACGPARAKMAPTRPSDTSATSVLKSSRVVVCAPDCPRPWSRIRMRSGAHIISTARFRRVWDETWNPRWTAARNPRGMGSKLDTPQKRG